jgi:hypothetical protein
MTYVFVCSSFSQPLVRAMDIAEPISNDSYNPRPCALRPVLYECSGCDFKTYLQIGSRPVCPICGTVVNRGRVGRTIESHDTAVDVFSTRRPANGIAEDSRG